MGDLTGRRVFLDAAGSAPMSPRTREAFVAAIDEGWADPERLHAESRRARALLDGAVESIAAVLRSPAASTTLVPTFGLAFDRAIGGVAKAREGRGRVVASAVERKPVLRTAARYGSDLSLVAVGADGRVDPAALAEALSDDVALALVQHANQETGVIQDLDAAHEAARAAGVPLVVDATASVGHADAPGAWDALAADAADWGGPRGVAVVASHPPTRLAPTPPVVTGRVNVAAALAAAVALEERETERAATAGRLAGYARRVREAAASLPDTTVFSPTEPALPHLVTFACARIDGEALAAELDRRGFAVGSGSACTVEPSPESHVWAALGVDSRGVLRVGLHPGVTDDDVARFVAALPEAARGA